MLLQQPGRRAHGFRYGPPQQLAGGLPVFLRFMPGLETSGPVQEVLAAFAASSGVKDWINSSTCFSAASLASP